MAIIRVNKTTDYTVMSNRHLRDHALSLKAKGLMSQMLALPDDWDYSITGLAAINKESEAAIKTALRELKDAGYLVITKKTPDQTESGRFEYIYDLYEDPDQKPKTQEIEIQQAEKQAIEKQEVEIQPLEIQPIENRRQLNTNKQNKEEQNKEELSKEDKERAQILNQYAEAFETFPILNNSPELVTEIIEFIKMRKKMKRIPTPHALILMINKAKQYSQNDPERMRLIFEQSIENGWLGIFELKDQHQRQQQRSSKNPFADLMAQEA